jgi:hypothetical protein
MRVRSRLDSIERRLGGNACPCQAPGAVPFVVLLSDGTPVPVAATGLPEAYSVREAADVELDAAGRCARCGREVGRARHVRIPGGIPS